MNKAKQLMELVRFSHTIFALPFALLGAVMAWTLPVPQGQFVPFQWTHLLGILICMVGARSAAMAFNRIVDRKIDAANPRTAQRHLPAGKLDTMTVIVFCIVSTAVFVAGTILFLPNWLPLALALPLLCWLFAYSYTKRYTAFAHFWLGISLMLAPMSAWIAIRGTVIIVEPLDLIPPFYLGLAILFWVAGFDIIYSCQDYQFDKATKLRSVPALLGIGNALRVAAACHLGMVLFLILLGLALSSSSSPNGLGWLYWLSLLAVAVLLTYEHWLVRPSDLSRVNVAFFNVNAIVSIGLFVSVLLDLTVV
jgi:4-hydroxybenzoate polyprenyltransferase